MHEAVVVYFDLVAGRRVRRIGHGLCLVGEESLVEHGAVIGVDPLGCGHGAAGVVC